MDACGCNLPSTIFPWQLGSAPNILQVESKRRILKSDPI